MTGQSNRKLPLGEQNNTGASERAPRYATLQIPTPRQAPKWDAENRRLQTIRRETGPVWLLHEVRTAQGTDTPTGTSRHAQTDTPTDTPTAIWTHISIWCGGRRPAWSLPRPHSKPNNWWARRASPWTTSLHLHCILPPPPVSVSLTYRYKTGETFCYSCCCISFRAYPWGWRRGLCRSC